MTGAEMLNEGSQTVQITVVYIIGFVGSGSDSDGIQEYTQRLLFTLSYAIHANPANL